MTIAVINKSVSATKSGPGRVHGQGLKKSKPPKAKGAGLGFLQHTNERANARRSVKADIGARQYSKQRKALAHAARPQRRARVS
jgi:hypothetical protein